MTWKRSIAVIALLLMCAWPVATQAPLAVCGTANKQKAGPIVSEESRLRLGVPRLSRGSPIIDMALSPDGKTLLTLHAEQDGTIFRWDLPSGKRFPYTTGNFKLGFSPKGQVVVLVGAGGTVLRELSSRGPDIGLSFSPTAQNVPGSCHAFSPDGRYLALSGEQRIQLWDARTGKLKEELPGKVVRLAYSPNGLLLASAGTDRSLRIWDVAARKEKLVLPKQSMNITALAFAPDGKTLVCASDRIRCFDANRGAVVGELPQIATARNRPPEHSAYFEEDYRESMEGAWVLTFSRDGASLATAQGNDIILWDPVKRAELRRLKGHGRVVRGLAFLPDGKTLISGSLDGTIRLWNMATGQEVSPSVGHQEEVTAVAFSPDGKTLATGSYDRTVRLWDFHKEKEIRAWRDLPEEVTGLAWSSDGKLLAAGDMKGTVFLWDAASGKQLRRIKRIPPKIALQGTIAARHLAFTARDTLLAVAGDDPGPVRLWEVQTGKPRSTLEVASECGLSYIVAMRLLADGKRLRTFDTMINVRTWDISSAKLLNERRIRELLEKDSQQGGWRIVFGYSGALSLDGQRIALCMVGYYLGTLSIKDLRRSPSRRIEIGKDEQDGFCAAFSPSGRSLATGSVEGPVFLREGATGKIVRRLTGHRAWVRSVAFSSDGRWLAAASANTTVLIWDTQAFSPSGW